MSKTRASCFIRDSTHLETIKELGLRPRAFICFSVFGTPDETLALVFDILLQLLCHCMLKTCIPKLRDVCLQHAMTQQRGKDIFVAKLHYRSILAVSLFAFSY